ncbi:His-Xaa-Ser system radical SAM maturase HxsB [Derxia gummosa]|uniref:His-Xaa-Ser system radical SAM maturase HxsB n=1 Tax=Derxia gummosa DSM 723 TaxID=1121388 RepID=A0A8B6X7R4_9BURK|nr:His-Xaa-Ser system radical SAM maturase HxsB [Derxia gummosa]
MSRFQPLNFYQRSPSRPSGYALLPFRFEALDDDEVVLSNMVGEFALLKRDKLRALVNHELAADDVDYARLRARHMLREPGDEAPVELLALKTRTRMAHLAAFTNLHIFVVSLRCDHSCQYCQVSRQSEDKARFDMSRETADKALDLMFRSPNRALKLEFQGGEPLLNFELIRYVVEQAEQRNASQGRDLRKVITTTLSLATDEMLRYCRDHDIHLSSSLDGPEDLHNKNRPRPGRDSHARFVDGLARARAIIGRDAVAALMTTSAASLPRVRDIIDEYVRLEFDGIFLRHLSPYGFALKTKSYQAYDSERWLDFYKEGLAYILELNRAGVPFREYYASILLTKMLTVRDPNFVDLSNPSGAGISAIVFNYDGDVYASDEARMLKEMGDATFCLGNVHTSSYEDIFTNEALLGALEDSFTLSAPGCSDCAIEPWCGADPVFHHGMTGDMLGRKPESAFCRRQMGVAKHLLRLMRDDPSARELFEGWVGTC